MSIDWTNAVTVIPKQYTCGYCNTLVGPNQGYTGTAHEPGRNVVVTVYICSRCNCPTFFDAGDTQWPGVAAGEAVGALPVDVAAVYDEARRCMSVSAYTTAVMACRKLLMHVAVEKGAEPNKSFKHYVDWMVENHYVPPGGAGWVDVIREDANEVNHQIVLMDQHRATQLLSFVELLLKFVYEFPARVAGSTAVPETQAGQPASGLIEGVGGGSGTIEPG